MALKRAVTESCYATNKITLFIEINTLTLYHEKLQIPALEKYKRKSAT